MNIADQIPDSIKRVSRCLGYAVFLDTSDAWLGLISVLRARMSDEQRVALAFAALRALDEDDVAVVVEHIACLIEGEGDACGIPLPTAGDVAGEAAWWADRALPEEREAYCLAAFKAMPIRRQQDFLDYVGRRAA